MKNIVFGLALLSASCVLQSAQLVDRSSIMNDEWLDPLIRELNRLTMELDRLRRRAADNEELNRLIRRRAEDELRRRRAEDELNRQKRMSNEEWLIYFKNKHSRPFSIVGSVLVLNNGLYEVSRSIFAPYLKEIDSRRITHVFFPDSVRLIHHKAFHDFRPMGVVFGVNSQLTSFTTSAFRTRQLRINIPASVVVVNTHVSELYISEWHVSFAQESKLKVVSDGVFYNSRIAAITIPANVTRLKYGAFSFCNKLQHVIFEPDSQLATIERMVFYNTAVRSIIIPSEVQCIGDEVFHGCYSLVSVKFEPGSRLISIGQEAFSETSLTSIDIPSSVRVVGKRAFFQCKYLHSVEFCDDLHADDASLTIESNAFADCALGEIIFPNIPTRVGSGILSRCDICRVVIHRVSLPDHISSSKLHTAGWLSNIFRSKYESDVGDIIRGLQCEVCLNEVNWRLIDSYTQQWGFFEGCEFRPVDAYVPEKEERDSGLDIIKIDPFFRAVLSKNIALFINFPIKNYTLKCIFGDSLHHVREIILPPDTKKVQDRAFINCDHVQAVYFPPTLEYIGKEAFYGCGLTEIRIPASVKEICSYTFSKCQLRSVTFDPSSQLKMIGVGAFADNHELKGITVPPLVEQIGERAFLRCKQMTTLTFLGSNIEVIKASMFCGCSSLKTIVLPMSVRSINTGAFSSHRSRISFSFLT
ncbi:MAG: leucine-rich repeat protein [Holosporales bacterium]|jgi:hypothetical protein|nr:leucine-rich repeat protein [Holosporales bacterium]